MKKILGIEFGSTRIKSVLIDENSHVIAQGSYEWKNELVDNLWSYSIKDVITGMQLSYADLVKNFGKKIESIDAIGISAMMHGYLAFDKNDNLLVPYRTWRNTNTEAASKELSDLFSFNIPMRWSVSHYYQAILNNEKHIKDVASINTLAGYVHFLLTGQRVLGIGDASGMFPIKNKKYNSDFLAKFNNLLAKHNVNVDFEYLLPQIKICGEECGKLTKEGTLLLDPTGALQPGSVCCPPEGDAGTGMVATKSTKINTANLSAGTSAFLMAVLKDDLANFYPEIDMVTTPVGDPVAMIHINNFTNEINDWMGIFNEISEINGNHLDIGKVFKKALEGDLDTGHITGCNFLSGEPIAGVNEGRPLIVRRPEGKFNLSNFMQYLIYSALSSLSLGMNILSKENIKLENVVGHGGFFKSAEVTAPCVSAAINSPITVLENAGEGGAWGVAILALYTLNSEKPLEDFLEDLFKNVKKTVFVANDKDKQKFNIFIEQYKKMINVEKVAIKEI